MAENPDIEITAPFIGMLRWLQDKATLTLQQYQYSATDNKDGWYDVPRVNAADLPAEPESENEPA